MVLDQKAVPQQNTAGYIFWPPTENAWQGQFLGAQEAALKNEAIYAAGQERRSKDVELP